MAVFFDKWYTTFSQGALTESTCRKPMERVQRESFKKNSNGGSSVQAEVFAISKVTELVSKQATPEIKHTWTVKQKLYHQKCLVKEGSKYRQ